MIGLLLTGCGGQIESPRSGVDTADTPDSALVDSTSTSDTGGSPHSAVPTADTGVATDVCDAEHPYGTAGQLVLATEWFAIGEQEQLGAEMLVADLDGDSANEVVIAGPATEFTISGYYTLANPGVYIVEPGAPGGAIDLHARTHFVGVGQFSSIGNSYGYGEALAIVPAGDGTADLLLAGGGEDEDYDAAFAFDGDERDRVGLAEAVGTVSVDVADPYGHFTEAVGSLDLTGDGQPDLVLRSTQDYQGALYLFTGLPVGEIPLQEAPSVVIGEPHERLGESLAAVDLDGDGVDELLAGGSQGSSGPGVVRVLSEVPLGTSSSGDYPGLFGEPEGLVAGLHSVAGGDLDGDGHGDVVTGDPGMNCWAGRAYVVHGPIVEDRSLADADTLIDPVGRMDALGSGLAIGDFDGDGQDDLAVGMPRTLTALAHPGRAAVFLGPLGSALLDETDAAVVWVGHGAGDLFGAVLTAGDVDADGRDDLLVAATNDSEHGSPLGGSVTLLSGGGL